MSCADLRVLFSPAAGARRGFGHLARCRSLARAMGVRPLMAVRGGARVIDTALVLGCDVIAGGRPHLVSRLRPDVLVVDDPVARNAGEWIAAGRRAGCLVVSIHDLGLGCLDAHIVVDGSLTHNARAARGITLAGPRYAVLDPALATLRAGAGNGTRVLISLGGGPRGRRAGAIAAAIARAEPAAQIRMVGGFLADSAGSGEGPIEWIDAPHGLGEALLQADIAVLGGGVSLFEACALGVPAVAVPVVRAQEPTVAAFVRQHAAIGAADIATSPDVIAGHAARLLESSRLRREVARTARAVVDGQGAARVVAAIAAAAGC